MKIFLKSLSIIIGFLLISINPLYANDTNVSNTIIGNGIGIGSALAIAICWTRTFGVNIRTGGVFRMDICNLLLGD